VSQRELTSDEIRVLKEVLSADHKNGSIRLREGEYQYNLAKAIASFLLELYFPDVKDIIKRAFGEEKTNDVQFIRKIQTILKKMEKSNIVRILPKKKPWELQRYALSSFKFYDVDKNLVILATDEEIKQVQRSLHSMLSQKEASTAKKRNIRLKTYMLMFSVVVLYLVSVWALVQPVVSPIIFVLAFSVAVACSLMLGEILSKR
jgi:hypothetical protein